MLRLMLATRHSFGPVGHGAGARRPPPPGDTPPPAANAVEERGSGYVSEFSRFMDDYLDHHPEVVTDQARGWSIWWRRKTGSREVEEAVRDTVPTDPYYYFQTPEH